MAGMSQIMAEKWADVASEGMAVTEDTAMAMVAVMAVTWDHQDIVGEPKFKSGIIVSVIFHHLIIQEICIHEKLFIVLD